MNALRHHCIRHRGVATLIVAVALLMRLLVPAGFMPVFGGGMTIELCTGFGPQAAPSRADIAMAAAMPEMADHAPGKSGHGGKEMPCGFGGLAVPSLAAADPILLALAIAFVFAAIFRAGPAGVVRAIAHLRPPQRGPPAIG